MDYKELYMEGMTPEQFEEVISKVVQSSQDKVRTEYTAKIKELEGKLPAEKSEKEIELETKLQEIAQKEKRFTLMEQLTKEGLPVGLAEHLSASADIAKLKNEFQQMVLNSGFKPTGHKPTETTITKEQFKTMGYSERVKLAETAPELYQALTQSK